MNKVSHESDLEPGEISMTKFKNYNSTQNNAEVRNEAQIEPEAQVPVKGKYPKIVFLIILNEFCERFSYYGIRTVLYLFLTQFIGLDKDTATAIYHAFTVVCYFSPVLGAILADGYIGLYRTILSVSCLYLTGEVVLTLFSMKPLGAPSFIGPAIGLTLIAFGTGGIKPCVSAFGGNQFGPNQKHYLDSFFSVFYASINVGSLIATLITPILRNDIKCYGKDCYPLAFGIPTIFMSIAIVVFALGTKFYRRDDEYKKGGSIITKTAFCIFTAVKNKIKKIGPKRPHWLDYADTTYSLEMINDVKALCRVLVVFLPLPVFWALYDQQGSRWTSQAQQLNGRTGGFTIKPDQFQAINPILIVAMVPLFDYVLYPVFAKVGLFKKQLSRMAFGLILAIVAFLIAAVLEWQMQESFAAKNPNYQLKLVNMANCDLTFTSNDKTFKVPQLVDHKVFEVDQSFINVNNYKQNFKVSGACVNEIPNLQLDTNTKQTLFLYANGLNLETVTNLIDVKKPEIGTSQIKFFGINIENSFGNLIGYIKEKNNERIFKIDSINSGNRTEVSYEKIDYDEYTFEVRETNTTFVKGQILLETCGRYSIFLFPSAADPKNLDYAFTTDIVPNGLSIYLQLVQIVVMSFGEVLFSISGLSFAYSQAPVTMKSVLQASWLLTVAFGNLIVLIIAEARIVDNQIWEYVIFAGLLAVATAIFILIAYFYRYVETEEDKKEKK